MTLNRYEKKFFSSESIRHLQNNLQSHQGIVSFLRNIITCFNSKSTEDFLLFGGRRRHVYEEKWTSVDRSIFNEINSMECVSEIDWFQQWLLISKVSARNIQLTEVRNAHTVSMPSFHSHSTQRMRNQSQWILMNLTLSHFGVRLSHWELPNDVKSNMKLKRLSWIWTEAAEKFLRLKNAEETNFARTEKPLSSWMWIIYAISTWNGNDDGAELLLHGEMEWTWVAHTQTQKLISDEFCWWKLQNLIRSFGFVLYLLLRETIGLYKMTVDGLSFG